VSSSGRFAWVGVLGLGVRQTGITFTLGNKIHLSGSGAGGHYATTKTNTEGSIPDFSLHNLFTLMYICLVLWWVSERLDICACIFFLFCYLAIDRRRGFHFYRNGVMRFLAVWSALLLALGHSFSSAVLHSQRPLAVDFIFCPPAIG
jgi:hypothetical protein